MAEAGPVPGPACSDLSGNGPGMAGLGPSGDDPSGNGPGTAGLGPSGNGEPQSGAESEWAALRRVAGLRMLASDGVWVRGSDARRFLQGQVSQDISELGAGQAADTLVLSPQGKLDAWARVVCVSEDTFLCEISRGFGPGLLERITRFRVRVKAEIEAVAEPWEIHVLGVRGPLAHEVAAFIANRLHAVLEREGEPGPVVVAAEASWPGLAGSDVIWLGKAGIGGELVNALPLGELDAGVLWCGEDAWESARVEAGAPVMGAEITPSTIPAEVPGLLERAVSFVKGCYTGQELVARLEARGSRVAKRLCGLVVEAGAGDAGRDAGLAALTAGSILQEAEGGKVIGSVTSTAWSYGLRGAVGLGYVHRSIEAGETVRVVGAQPVIRVMGLPMWREG